MRLRRIFGTLSGIVAAMMVVGGMDFLGRLLVPEAATVGAGDFAAVPVAVKIVMAVGWFLATLVGGLIAARLTRWRASGWIVAGLILAACLYNGFMIPGVPLWMQIAGVVVPLLGGLIVRAVSRPV